jgi:hypothetical protein
MSEHRCPACGYDLGFPPWNGDSASDEICPSCGIQFGYDDAPDEARDDVYRTWRADWVADGMQWWSRAQPAPADWDGGRQLRDAPILVDA